MKFKRKKAGIFLICAAAAAGMFPASAAYSAVIRPPAGSQEAQTDADESDDIVTVRKPTAVEKAKTDYADDLKNSVASFVNEDIFITCVRKDSDVGSYFLTHVIINDVSMIKGGLSYDDWGGTREKPTSFAERHDAALVINGSYFSYDTGKPFVGGGFVKNGEIPEPGFTVTTNGDGLTYGEEVCLDKNGKLFVPQTGLSAQDLLDMGVTDVWGTADPAYINEGAAMDVSDQHKPTAEYYPRTALGMVEPGEYYIATADSPGYGGGLSWTFMQKIFLDLDCTFARSFDGGGSSSLVIDGKLVNTPATGEERPVVDFIYFTKEPEA